MSFRPTRVKETGVGGIFQVFSFIVDSQSCGSQPSNQRKDGKYLRSTGYNLVQLQGLTGDEPWLLLLCFRHQQLHDHIQALWLKMFKEQLLSAGIQSIDEALICDEIIGEQGAYWEPQTRRVPDHVPMCPGVVVEV